MVGNRSLSDCLGVLVPGGRFVPCSGGGGDWVGPFFRIVAALVRSLFSSQKVKTFVTTPRQADLLFLKELVEAGKARPVLERRYPLSEVAEALRHVGEGHSQGQTVVQIAG
jgi:NADPH:quinone reductase-like Zn-dependent oxidoreductase